MERKELTAITSYLYKYDKKNPLWSQLWEILNINGTHPRCSIAHNLNKEQLEEMEQIKAKIKKLK